MNKNKLILVILFSLITLISCSKKDTFYQFCISSDYDPESYRSHNYASEGNIIFGQYYRVGGGFLHGTSCGMNKTYQGLPEGELIAFLHSYKYDEENGKEKIHPGTETFYYAYEPDVKKINIPPKGKGHRKYSAFFSYGRFELRPAVLNGMDLTNVPYTESPSNMKFYQVEEIDKLYVKIFSHSSEYKSFKFDGIHKTPPSEFFEIKAIEITEEQYFYFMWNIADRDEVHLNESVPGFMEEQKKYMDVRKRIGKE